MLPGIHHTAARWVQWRRLPSVRGAVLTALPAILTVVLFLGISIGAVNIPGGRINAIIQDRLADRLGLRYDSGLDYSERDIARDATLILDIRLPRVLLAGLVGASLALAGAGLQAVFRNPLADPGLIGIGSGAAAGAVTSILLGIDPGPVLGFVDGRRLAGAVAAFCAALLTTLAVYRMAYRQRRTDSTALLLIGLAVNAIAASYVGMATFAARQAEAGDITFWTLGSAAGAFWRDVHLMLPFTLVGLVAFPLLARPLNLMALGEAEARHLGVSVERLRALTLILSALLVGAGVALVGMVGFVGLVVPNVLRLLLGPDQRLLLPASAVGGAAFVMGADVFARTIAAPGEIPLGVVTTLVGGPFFLAMILIYRRGMEG